VFVSSSVEDDIGFPGFEDLLNAGLMADIGNQGSLGEIREISP
jgi:hypothetical protein